MSSFSIALIEHKLLRFRGVCVFCAMEVYHRHATTFVPTIGRNKIATKIMRDKTSINQRHYFQVDFCVFNSRMTGMRIRIGEAN